MSDKKRTLEVGKEYVTRSGEKVKCVHIFECATNRLIQAVCVSRDQVLTYSASGDFNLYPTELDIIFPKTTRIRPWKLEEVPLGKVVVKGKLRALITQAFHDCDMLHVRVGNFLIHPQEIINDGYTIEDGSPCGVVEEVEE